MQRAPWMERPNLLWQVGKPILLLLLAFVMLFPFVYVLSVSLSSAKDVLAGGIILWPRNPTTEAYAAVLRSGVVSRSLLITAGITVVGTAAQMVMTILLAYGLSRPQVPGSRIVMVLVVGSMLFWPGLIPSYLLMKELRLLNTYSALIVPGLINAFNLIILRNFFMHLPQELLESARIDGASNWRILRDILLPLSGAVLAVLALFYGVAIWNSFFNAVLYLNDPQMWPIQVVLRQYVLQGTRLTVDSGALNAPPPPPQTIRMAVVVIATVPILLVYPFLQKYFTRGVLTGAIKG